MHKNAQCQSSFSIFYSKGNVNLNDSALPEDAQIHIKHLTISVTNWDDSYDNFTDHHWYYFPTINFEFFFCK